MSFPIANDATPVGVRAGKFFYGPAAARVRIVLAVFLGTILCAPVAADPAQPDLAANPTLATAGYFTLSWSAEDTTQFELQQSKRSSFSQADTLYRGADTATIISGRGDGEYYFRVRALGTNGAASQWSETVKVDVAHHSLGRAVGFFITGAVMFVLTLWVLIHGAHRHA